MATYTVTYTLTPEMELRIDYTGLSDADTIFNPTNHSYFNLAGHDAGDSAMDQFVWINANRFTQTDKGIHSGWSPLRCCRHANGLYHS